MKSFASLANLTGIASSKKSKGKLDLPEGRYLQLSVRDTGHGMPQEMADRVFEPYFTTRKLSEGIGLGLSIVHGIVKSHKGAIAVESSPDKGTSFHLYFPLSQNQASRQETTTRKEDAAVSQPRRILFVDDEKMGGMVWKIALKQEGYHVDFFSRGVEALEAFRVSPEGYDVVVTDQKMPEMTGTQLAGELLKIRQDIPVVLVSGWSDSVCGVCVRTWNN